MFYWKHEVKNLFALTDMNLSKLRLRSAAISLYRVVHKNVPSYFCPYLCQILIDFQNYFTGTLLMNNLR